MHPYFKKSTYMHVCRSKHPLIHGDDIEYKEDPAVAQAKANLMAAEHIQ